MFTLSIVIENRCQVPFRYVSQTDCFDGANQQNASWFPGLKIRGARLPACLEPVS